MGKTAELCNLLQDMDCLISQMEHEMSVLVRKTIFIRGFGDGNNDDKDDARFIKEASQDTMGNICDLILKRQRLINTLCDEIINGEKYEQNR